MNSLVMRLPYHALVFLTMLSACIAFNEEGEELEVPIGTNTKDWDLRYQSVRNQESIIGNLVADAVLAISRQQCKQQDVDNCPQLAFVNSGAIRQQYFLTTRDKIPAGLLYQTDIEQLLPFSDGIVIVSLKGKEILLALEHAVSRLGQSERTQAPYFLSVAGLSFAVDCALEPQALSFDGLHIIKRGERISQVMLTSTSPPLPIEPNIRYRVAMTTYLADGNNGFIAFVQRDRNEKAISGKGRFLPRYAVPDNLVLNENLETLTLAQSVIQWIKSFTLQGRFIHPPEINRIKMDKNCRIPKRA